MRCSIQRKLSDYQVGLLSPPERERVAAHLEVCASCRKEYAALQRTAEMLQPMPLRGAPPEVWRGVQSRLKPRRKSVGHPLRLRRPALALAMVMLIVVMAVFMMPMLHHQANLPLAPSGDSYVAAQLSAAWDTPLSDSAAIGLAMVDMTADKSVSGVVD